MAVRVGVPVRHCIPDSDKVVAVIVGAAHRRFDTGTRRDARHEYLGYAALPQGLIQRCADERAPLVA